MAQELQQSPKDVLQNKRQLLLHDVFFSPKGTSSERNVKHLLGLAITRQTYSDLFVCEPTATELCRIAISDQNWGHRYYICGFYINLKTIACINHKGVHHSSHHDSKLPRKMTRLSLLLCAARMKKQIKQFVEVCSFLN